MLVAGPDDSDGMEAFNGGAATPFLSRTPQIAMTTAGGESLRRSLPGSSNMFAGLINKKINLTEAEPYQSCY